MRWGENQRTGFALADFPHLITSAPSISVRITFSAGAGDTTTCGMVPQRFLLPIQPRTHVWAAVNLQTAAGPWAKRKTRTIWSEDMTKFARLFANAILSGALALDSGMGIAAAHHGDPSEHSTTKGMILSEIRSVNARSPPNSIANRCYRLRHWRRRPRCRGSQPRIRLTALRWTSMRGNK